MTQPKVSVVIVTWNGDQYIEKCLQSLFDQSGVTESPFDVLVIDNGSTDDTLTLIQEKFSQRVKVVKNKENIGFAKAYNQGIHWTSGRYVLALNQDAYLQKTFLSEAVNFLDNYPRVAAVNAQIMRWQDPGAEPLLDSLGIGLDKRFSFTNFSEGEKQPVFKTITPVFGFTATAVLLRRAALYDVAWQREFFDESFFSYKEDVDLSWRLRWRNWDIVYLPYAVAYHRRTAKKNNENSSFTFSQVYLEKPDLIKYLSYRNHLYTLIKNLHRQLLFRYFFPLFWYEIRKFIFLLFTRPRLLFRSWRDLFTGRRTLWAKRKHIMNSRKINPMGISIWIN